MTVRSASHLQGVDGDGAAPPAVQVADSIYRGGAAKQHQPAEQVLLGDGEQDLEQTGLCRHTHGSNHKTLGGAICLVH